MNRFVFVLNNPLRYIDPDGLKEKTAWEQLTEDEQKIIAQKLTIGKGADSRERLQCSSNKEKSRWFNRCKCHG